MPKHPLGHTRLLALLLTALFPTQLPAQVPILANDNRHPAGQLRGGILVLRLEAADGIWHPEAEDSAGLHVAAFGEQGKALTNPGPVVLVPAGTKVRVILRNTLADGPLVVHGLGDHSGAGEDSLVVPSGETRSAEFQAVTPGTFFYWGTRNGSTLKARRAVDTQLSGIIVVDPPGARPDRLFLMGVWIDSVNIAGTREEREVPTINGKMYPFTEPFTFTVGDTVRWRWINASDRVHPMHLHEFYFRVDSRGDAVRDTVYGSRGARRWAVTETMQSGTTMAIAWVAERPGNWLSHCHILFHVSPDLHLGAFDEHAPGAMEHMSGLVTAIMVRPAAPRAAPTPATPRRLRLLAQSHARWFGDSLGMGFALQEGPAEPAPDSIRIPGPPIVLTRGEPAAITVVNHLGEPTTVHWHGMELESYYDGVPGLSGDPLRLAPTIAPGDSFVARFTPPRAGTFIYHTHIDDVRQMENGLYGPLLVLEPGDTFDPRHDHVIVIGSRDEAESVLWNGRVVADTLTLTRDARARLRFVVIPSAGDAEVALLQDTTVLTWTPLSKDGRDLPIGAQRPRPSSQRMAVGETYDFLFGPVAPGVLRFVLRDGASVFFTAPVRVR
ncbi:MAG: hypothetical protein EXR93_08140 [Gemmatimonadetes bacterium]|nr:hypothetical protein [Gemmatimonadota bacterium]